MPEYKPPIFFSDYAFLNTLKKVPTARLCELAILRELSAHGRQLEPYNEQEHERIWQEVFELFKHRETSGTVIDYLWIFIKQFSPKENELLPSNANHISHYVRTALDVETTLGKRSNILELGSNHGILSSALEIMNHSVLCTDIHYGMIGSLIDSYKAGTLLREHFIGLTTVDSFIYPKDVHYLSVFKDGLDAIIMRGTGILNIEIPVEYKPLPSRILSKIFRKQIEKKNQHQIVLHNCSTLLEGMNPGGVLFAAEENLFWNMDKKERLLAMEKLIQDLKNLGYLAEYEIKEYNYVNEGWMPFNVTLKCIKQS